MKMKVNCFLSCFLLLLFCFSFAKGANVDSLLTILKVIKEDSTKVNTYDNLFLEFEFSDRLKAENYLNKALLLSQKIDYKTGLYKIYMHFGYLAEDKGNYPLALNNYFSSLKVAEDTKNQIRISAIQNNIGNVYYFQGNYPDALSHYFSSLKACETINDLKNKNERKSETFNNIGNVYLAQSNFRLALENFFASLKIVETMGGKEGLSNPYNNIGNVYYTQGNYPEALKNHFKALEIRKELGDNVGVSASLGNIAGIYSAQGDYPASLKNYFACLEIFVKANNKAGMAGSYGNIGQVLTKQKKYNEAEKYLNKSKEISEEIGYKEYIKGAYDYLTTLDSAKGDFKAAYENHKLYILYRDSIDNEQSRKKTIQSQMTYDFEKKEAVATAEHKKELENQQTLSNVKSRKQKVVLFLVSCFLLLVIVFAGFIFRSLRVTSKQKNIIEQQKDIVELQKQEVEHQKLIVEEHQKEIIDSIYYARRIQRSLLPTEKYIERNINRLKKS